MGRRIVFFLYYFVFWILYFVLSRIVFLFYHSAESFEYSWINWLQTVFYGISMDVSAAAILCVIPAVTLLLTTHIRGGKISSIVINVYTCIFLLVLTVLNVLDMEIYQQNGERIQSTINNALSNGNLFSFFTDLEMMNWVKNIVIFIVVCVVFIAYYFESVGSIIAYFKKANILTIILLLALTVGLYFPMKYGIHTIKLEDTVNHSDSKFLNDATVNPIWQLGKPVLAILK